MYSWAAKAGFLAEADGRGVHRWCDRHQQLGVEVRALRASPAVSSCSAGNSCWCGQQGGDMHGGGRLSFELAPRWAIRWWGALAVLPRRGLGPASSPVARPAITSVAFMLL